MIEFDNLGAFIEGLDQWVEDTHELATGVYRGLAVEAFEYIVLGTPEWSGNLASNWRLTVGQAAVGYDPSIWKEQEHGGHAINPEPFSRVNRNQAAVAYAMTIAREQMRFVRLGADVYITNTAPYADDVANNIAGWNRNRTVRAINHPIEMTHAAAQKFGAEGPISMSRAVQLSYAVPHEF